MKEAAQATRSDDERARLKNLPYTRIESHNIDSLLRSKKMEPIYQAQTDYEKFVAAEKFLNEFLGPYYLFTPETYLEYELQSVANWYFTEKTKLKKKFGV